MSDDRSVLKLAEMKDQASRFAERATQLSDVIEAIEAFLDEVPGASGVFEENGHKLSYYQKSIEFTPATENSKYTLTTAPVHIKVLAAPLIQGLLDKVYENLTRKVDEVTEALDSIAKIELPQIDVEDLF